MIRGYVDNIDQRIKDHDCVICGWKVPADKGYDPSPLCREEGAICCKWCSENTVAKARKIVIPLLSELLHHTVGEERAIKLQKEQINDR